MKKNYELLVQAIVRRAVEDYEEALLNEEYDRAKALDRWFHSEWGQMLCYHNEDYILDRARKEVIAKRKEVL